MSNSLLRKFTINSSDFLILLAEKKRRGKGNATFKAEADIMEVFFMSMERMYIEAQKANHSALYDRMMSKLLEKELELSIRAAISKTDKDLKNFIKHSPFKIPELQIGKPVEFKEKKPLDDQTFQIAKAKLKEGAKLFKVTNNYIVTENQLNELIKCIPDSND